jgi:hypothetical protein
MKAEILNIETLVDGMEQEFYTITLRFRDKPKFSFDKFVDVEQK